MALNRHGVLDEAAARPRLPVRDGRWRVPCGRRPSGRSGSVRRSDFLEVPIAASFPDGVVPDAVPASVHGIAPERIHRNVRQILERLGEAGFEAYLVGGGVRDLLLGRTPKDFDVATSAHPEEVRALFPRSRLIGRRFRLAHVRSGREVYEVATFRANHDAATSAGSEGMLLHDNVYGTREEDALRRDFTVNALYFDARDGTILDFTGGMADLAAGVIRCIGEPAVRYREDPVRILRAVRFAAKLGFRIEASSETPIGPLAPLLEGVPAARLFEEILKLFHGGHARESLRRLDRHGLLARLCPATAASAERDPRVRALLERAFENTDLRLAEDRPVSPGFLVAALLWGPVRERADRAREEGRVRSRGEALAAAADEAIAAQAKRTSMPRRFTAMAREIWTMQPRLENRRPRRVETTIAHPRFRAAYDFLCLRGEAGEPVAERAQWWTAAQQDAAGPGGPDEPVRGRRRGRRSNRRRRAA